VGQGAPIWCAQLPIRGVGKNPSNVADRPLRGPRFDIQPAACTTSRRSPMVKASSRNARSAGQRCAHHVTRPHKCATGNGLCRRTALFFPGSIDRSTIVPMRNPPRMPLSSTTYWFRPAAFFSPRDRLSRAGTPAPAFRSSFETQEQLPDLSFV